MAWTASDEVVEQCSNLVRLASLSDLPEGLVIAASRQLRRSLVLFNPSGAPLAAAPRSDGSDPPVAVLAAARANPDEAPEGWRVIPIERGRERLAFIAVRNDGAWEPEQQAMLDLILALLGDQLKRASLARTIRSERRAAFTRRLVTDHTITPAEIRSEGAAAGLNLADSYWPAMLVWRTGHPGPRTLAELHGEAKRQVPGSIAVALDNTTVALLVPAHGPGAANREDVHRRLACLVRHVRQLGHRDVCAIAGEHSVGVADLSSCVGGLKQLRRYLPYTATEALVRPARTFALDCLLSEGLDRQRAQAFIHGRLGRLLRHDQDHGTDLGRVLELALDFRRREDAARANYMHRNTFRRRLTQARDLVEADFEDPDDRLAVHLALKLRRLMEAPHPTLTARSSQRLSASAQAPRR